VKYQNALDSYVKYLNEAGYGKGEIDNKRAILSKRLSYALVLFHPAIPDSLKEIDRPRFYGRGRIYYTERSEKIETVTGFLKILKKEQQEIRYLNMISFLEHHHEEMFHENESIHGFLRAIGFCIDLDTITEPVFGQSMQYLRSGASRDESCSRSFFKFCFSRDWLSFNPNKGRKDEYARVFEADFLAGVEGKWRRGLEEYIDYLRFEKNFSDGGVDYNIRKLKVFTVWLSERKGKRPTTELLKQFLEYKKDKGVKDITLGKYLYTIKYFFDFMIDRGRIKTNPALELKIKSRSYAEGDVLSEPEVLKVIEYLDEEISQREKQSGIVGHKYHFIAVRNLCLFHILITTGLRLSEISRMRLKDIDAGKKTIHITAKGNRNVRQKIREAQLDDYVWQALQNYLKVREEPGQEYLWISQNNLPLSNCGLNAIVKTMIEKTGINKRISPHRLRATCASRYVREGMDPVTLKTIMGHRSITTTIDQYVQLTEEELREIWKKTNPLAGMDDE
jgi:integrase/recombinase XerD|tara:strand:- start:1028 stop:2545 length:1518 start_codon:yes stop_codon:yes gene_type:complete